MMESTISHVGDTPRDLRQQQQQQQQQQQHQQQVLGASLGSSRASLQSTGGTTDASGSIGELEQSPTQASTSSATVTSPSSSSDGPSSNQISLMESLNLRDMSPSNSTTLGSLARNDGNHSGMTNARATQNEDHNTNRSAQRHHTYDELDDPSLDEAVAENMRADGDAKLPIEQSTYATATAGFTTARLLKETNGTGASEAVEQPIGSSTPSPSTAAHDVTGQQQQQQQRQQHQARENVFGHPGGGGSDGSGTIEGDNDDEDEEVYSAFAFDGKKPWFFGMTGSANKEQATNGPTWIPDSMASQCHDCKTPFDFFTRKHHCRNCGRIFCNKCSSHYLLLPEVFGLREPQRVCQPCATELEPHQEDLVRTISNQTRTLAFDASAPSKYFNNTLSFSMTAEIRKAAHSVENFFGHCPNASLNDQYIPSRLLKQAKGLAFLTVIKAGFLFTGRFGTGLVVGKTDRGEWSAPSAIATAGIGWGAQIGGEVSDFVIILNTTAALDAFSGAGQLSLGAELGMSVGPIGRSGEASLNMGDGGAAPCYTYSQSKGMFVGISLEGAIISTRSDVNKRFYGREYSRVDLLSGRVVQPTAALPLYQALETALARPNDPLPIVVSNFIGRTSTL